VARLEAVRAERGGGRGAAASPSNGLVGAAMVRIEVRVLGCRDRTTPESGGPREATGEGGEWELNQILLREPIYVPSSNPKPKTLQYGDEHINQQHRNDPLKS
jgi:hypothetical protein